MKFYHLIHVVAIAALLSACTPTTGPDDVQDDTTPIDTVKIDLVANWPSFSVLVMEGVRETGTFEEIAVVRNDVIGWGHDLEFNPMLLKETTWNRFSPYAYSSPHADPDWVAVYDQGTRTMLVNR